MTRPNTQGGASALPNVVRLPTAARRQVKQPHNKASRAVRQGLPRLPVEYILPCVREQLPRARLLAEYPASPEMALARCLFAAMDEGTQARAVTMLKILALKCPTLATVALFYVEPQTYGDQSNLDAARRLIEEGRA